jgi:hypothetical protein
MKIEARNSNLAADRHDLFYHGQFLKEDATIASTGVTETDFLGIMCGPNCKVRSDASR